jgi:hypothetical protein
MQIAVIEKMNRVGVQHEALRLQPASLAGCWISRLRAATTLGG